jgi:DNA-directed RNA polymerase sigma subunit (sigma70/sigma32)
MVARMTQAEVARALGLSRGRIVQIEASALRKLRRGLAEWRDG